MVYKWFVMSKLERKKLGEKLVNMGNTYRHSPSQGTVVSWAVCLLLTLLLVDQTSTGSADRAHQILCRNLGWNLITFMWITVDEIGWQIMKMDKNGWEWITQGWK